MKFLEEIFSLRKLFLLELKHEGLDMMRKIRGRNEKMRTRRRLSLIYSNAKVERDGEHDRA